ncbi:MAG: hypothetical protein H7A55_20225 [Verrucomicrobiaceae bacterium]|nr:hypothetical protein [Verrucomicrobiaceae bacterium]
MSASAFILISGAASVHAVAVTDLDQDGIPNISDPDVDNDGLPNGTDPNVDGGLCVSGPLAGRYIGDRLNNDHRSERDIDGDGLADGSLIENDIDGDGLKNDDVLEDDIDGDGKSDDAADELNIDGDAYNDDSRSERDIDGDGKADDSLRSLISMVMAGSIRPLTNTISMAMAERTTPDGARYRW